MTLRQLNNRIKILAQRHHHESFKDIDTFFKYIENEFKPEFKTCYNAADLQDLSKESILILLRLNLRHRVIELHQFGININYNNFI